MITNFLESIFVWFFDRAAIWVYSLILFFSVAYLFWGVAYLSSKEEQEKEEFFSFCLNKGHSLEECRWEWKRINSGSDSQIIFMPMGR